MIVRGDANGYNDLMSIVQANLANPDPSFAPLFGLIITNQPKPERFVVFNKLWA